MSGYQPLNGFVPETFSFYNDLSYDTQSHELRLNGESAKLNWQIGGFYGKENQDVRRGLFLPSAAGSSLITTYNRIIWQWISKKPIPKQTST